MPRWAIVAILGLACLGMAGCPSTQLPNLRKPGTAWQQQRNAEQYDPYPQPHLGSDTSGVRPRDFDQPGTLAPRSLLP